MSGAAEEALLDPRTSLSPQEQGERRKQEKLTRQAWQASLVVATILVGVVTLMWGEDLDFSETLYVVTQIVTTIGYGDIAIHGDWDKLFVAFYALWVLVLVAFFLNNVIQSTLDAQEDRVRQRLRAFEAQCQRYWDPNSNPKEEDVRKVFGKYNRLAYAMGIFAAHLLFGTLFFAYWERCTCSYGQLEKGDCTPETACENGYTIGLIDSFYMSVVTLTTVGFGDFSPKSYSGRIIGIFWMVSGIVSTASFLEAMQQIFFQVEEENKLDQSDIVNEKLFAQIDDDKDHTLSENDFLHYCILQQRLMDPELLDDIKELYRKIDYNKSHTITMQDIRRHTSQRNTSPRFREGARSHTRAELIVKSTGCVTM